MTIDGARTFMSPTCGPQPAERVSEQEDFQADAGAEARASITSTPWATRLFRNIGGDRFDDASMRSGTAVGRWAWSSDSWDFDHDGFPDLYIANGMISGVIAKTI